METIIYHNPRCGTSRTVLATLRERGVAPKVIEYLATPPDKTMLIGLLAALELSPRNLMRRKEAVYRDLALDDPGKSDDELVEAMVAHPILIERPIVVTGKGVRLCRPAHRVLEIL
jgi:arsenate reductase (glutaredoxin)